MKRQYFAILIDTEGIDECYSPLYSNFVEAMKWADDTLFIDNLKGYRYEIAVIDGDGSNLYERH